MSNKIKYTLHDLKKIATSKGGKCLSSEIKTTKNYYKWECSNGHIWEAQLKNILEGRWCPECAHAKRRNDISFCHELALKKGGKCLSQEYINIDTKLLWECDKKHQWWATPNKIKNGRWCPYCAGKYKTIEDFKKLAREKSGECLSNEYKLNKKKLTWKCSKGHIWEASPNNVKFSTWCPYCAGKHQNIVDMKVLAEERGGKCLSEKYISQTRKLKWQCSDGHTWDAIPNSIKQGSWCPYCNINYGEETVRKYFEAIFNDEFNRVKPNWLNGLELDGYSEKLKIAFEHQGIQHYKQIKRFHKNNSDFKKQQNRDKIKRELCIQEGIILIEIPHVPDITSLDVLPVFLEKAFLKNNIVINKNIFDIEIDLKSIYGQSQIDYLKNIAHKNNGYLLSDCYLGDRHKLTWKCKEGHMWESSPNSIKQGTWCPFCYGNVRKDISDIQLLAKQKSITLLSDEYLGTNTKLKWQCSFGHIWEASPRQINNSTGCPKCIGKGLNIEDVKRYCLENNIPVSVKSEKYNGLKSYILLECNEGHTFKMRLNKLKLHKQTPCPICRNKNIVSLKNIKQLTICKNIAHKKGGKLLSNEYVGIKEYLLWECSKGHQWEATPDAIKHGRWCPKCASIKRNKDRIHVSK